MSVVLQCVGIIGKPGDPSVKDTLLSLAGFLLARGQEVILEDVTAKTIEEEHLPSAPLSVIARRCDLAIVVGGDGTLLHAARNLAHENVPLIGVNLGRLGFLTDISPDDMAACLEQILRGEYDEEQRFLLRTTIGTKSSPGHPLTALNDVVMHKWNIARMIEFEIYVDGCFVDTQRSDGLIVSTPTGSTAYALSGGGPLLAPELNAVVIVPICPHTLSNRPIVISAESQVEIAICDGHHPHIRVTCDGQTSMPVGKNERIRICKDDHHIRLLHPRGHDHFQILRSKLGWGEVPRRR